MEFGRQSGSFARRWSPEGMSVVMMLIVANVAVSLLQWSVEVFSPNSNWMELYLGLSREGMAEGYYWQLVTYMFLHGGWLHLLVNCLGLYFAGREVEIVCGPRHLLGMYFLGGLAGGILQLLWVSSNIPLVGASAGVCAVLLAFTTMLPELEITALLFFVIPLRMRAKWLGRIVVGSSLFFMFSGLGGNIGHAAHLGGALLGWFYARRLGFGGAFWFQRFVRERRRTRERQERMDSSEFISREIDPILDKIAKEGIHSLTRAERRILELGREKIAKKSGPPSMH
ncbi:MAG: rhomboid family intramembrane serine protease [Verrucomicrobiota bacterium]